MDRIKIRIENLYQTLKLFQYDKNLQYFLWLEGFVLLIVLVFTVYSINALPRIEVNSSIQTRAVPDKREEITVIPSSLFYSESQTIGQTRPGFPQLNLTGTGKVKGIYKASIEDAEGNYYYVREGERVKGLLVKKINGSEALLTDSEGNQLTLKLER
jgi:hypothetical protein